MKDWPALNEADLRFVYRLQVEFMTDGGRIKSTEAIPRLYSTNEADRWICGRDPQQKKANWLNWKP